MVAGDTLLDLAGQSFEIQCNYERLVSLPLGLDPDPKCLVAAKLSDTHRRVYAALDRYIQDYPFLFPSMVDTAENKFQGLSKGTGTPAKSYGRILAFDRFMVEALKEAEEQTRRLFSEDSLATYRGSTQAASQDKTRGGYGNDTLVGVVTARSEDKLEEESEEEQEEVEDWGHDGDVKMEEIQEEEEEDDLPPSPSLKCQNLPVSSPKIPRTPAIPRSLRTVDPPIGQPLIHKLRMAAHPYAPRHENHLRRSDTSISTSTESRRTSSTSTFADTSLTETPVTSLEELPIAGPSSSTKGWKPMSPPSADQQRVYVTPRTGYEGMITRLGITYDILWRFEYLLQRNSYISWSDVTVDDLQSLRGTSAEVVPRLEEVINIAVQRKTGQTGHIRKRLDAASTRDKLVRTLQEIDQEEDSLLKNDMKGLGAEGNTDWPYGGKVTYSIIVRPTRILNSTCISTQAGVQPINPNPTRKSEFRRVKSAPAQSNFLVGKVPVRSSTDPGGITTDPRLPFTMELQSPEMTGKSFRLARRFGSRRIITFKFKAPKDFPSQRWKMSALELLRGRIFVVFGKSFRAIWAPSDSDNVFLIETDDSPAPSFLPISRHSASIPLRLCDVLSMFNDMEAKPGQAIAKWAARPQLLFTDTVPAAVVEKKAITVVEDIVTAEATYTGHASTEQILTDGCGLMSESLAQRIFRHPSLTFESGRPSVVQIRLGGSKGLLVLMCREQEALYPGIEVVLRESMVKALPSLLYQNDPSHYIVEVVRSEVLKIGTFLSPEPISIMVHCGVSSSTILRLGMQSLEDIRLAFSPIPRVGEGDVDVRRRLHAACYRYGGVGGERKKRELSRTGLSAKVAGLVTRSKDTGENGADDPEEDDPPELLSSSERFDIDPITRQPGSLAESLMEAIAGGFSPLDSFYACGKLHFLMRQLLESTVRNLKIRVENSLSAFIVPDSLGILAPDEIFIRFTNNCPINPITRCPMTHLEGDVLALRSPCKLPTDVRKFKAVYRSELAHLMDCIVMSTSTACNRSPASFLGGGDYDGDMVQLFWDPELVNAFKNADESYADIPKDFEETYFEKERLSCGDFLDQIGKTDPETKITNIQDFLLGALDDRKDTGVYSNLHANAVYKLGLDHPETLDLARIFCHVLDARKSGLKLRPGIRAEHMRRYDGHLSWMAYKAGREESNGKVELKRPQRLGTFIMDSLMRQGCKRMDDIMGEFLQEPLSDKRSLADYEDLRTPWRNSKDVISRCDTTVRSLLEAELVAIKRHVEACYDVWELVRSQRVKANTPIEDLYNQSYTSRRSCTMRSPSKLSRPDTPSGDRSQSSADKVGLLRLTQMRQLAVIWRDVISVEQVPYVCMGDSSLLARLKVGCGAETVSYKQKQVFTFDMDFETTRALKSLATGATSYVLSDVYDSLKPGWKES